MAKIKTIKLGYKNYTIKKPKKISEFSGEYYGTCDNHKTVIRIADKFCKDIKNQCFIHEILHCLCHQFGLLELNKDEHTIDLLAKGIYEAIKDNPNIFTMADI